MARKKTRSRLQYEADMWSWASSVDPSQTSNPLMNYKMDHSKAKARWLAADFRRTDDEE
jgi:hypothetical protein